MRQPTQKYKHNMRESLNKMNDTTMPLELYVEIKLRTIEHHKRNNKYSQIASCIPCAPATFHTNSVSHSLQQPPPLILFCRRKKKKLNLWRKRKIKRKHIVLAKGRLWLQTDNGALLPSFVSRYHWRWYEDKKESESSHNQMKHISSWVKCFSRYLYGLSLMDQSHNYNDGKMCLFNI